MPATRRRSGKTGTGDGARDPDSLLDFNEPLSWKAGRAIPIADLLSRLRKLAKELQSLEPEGEVDPKSVKKVAQDLASPNLLAHKDKGIRAWTACCVVDLLRICVPHAPFHAPQLKDIFALIVNHIIPQLADPSNAYNDQHLKVLASLADVHSICLITDLDRPEQLILSLFASSFDIVSGSAKASTDEEVTKAVESYLTKILIQVIEESSSITPEITDVIIAQFIRVDPRTADQNVGKKKDTQARDDTQSNLLYKTYPRAYLMAKAVCSSIPERMTTPISQYFNNVIMDASESAQTNGHSTKGHIRRGSFGDADEEVADLKDLSKAHRLIRELWRACPDVLQHVIPQVEAELSAESATLRLVATETIGDVAAGVGVAGCSPPVSVDPAAYPPQTLADPLPSLVQDNLLQIPMSPKPFNQVHASAYESFLSRKQDKAASVRAAWATGAARILLTSAGGIGFADGEEQKLKAGIAQLLGDADDKVRMAAIKAVGQFGFGDTMSKLAPDGPISSPNSILAVLSDRVRDRRNLIREEAMQALAQKWAAAAGEIEKGNKSVLIALGDAPSKLLDAYYVNEPEVHVLLDRVLFEYLLPLSYPPIKSKASKLNAKGDRNKSSQAQDDNGEDADLIRVQRILTLLQSLDDKAKKVFFGMQNRQTQVSRVMAQYLKACEAYNGGVIEYNEVEVQKDLTKWVEAISRTLPDPTRVALDLRKFAKIHDRRNYQLFRFCMNPESDYRTVIKAIKELSKRIQAKSVTSPSLDTITSLLYRCSLLIYNRSHVPGIVKISRSEDSGLAEVAHEFLKEMSARTPEVLKTHVQELCKDLESTAPTASTTEEVSAPDMLKACAEFARRFPADIPRDRKFLVALTNYALYSRSPRSAKHAVSIIMAATEKKAMYAADLIQKATTDCEYSSPNFLTRLATISQINLLEPKAADGASDSVNRITIQEILYKNRHPTPSANSYLWSTTPDPESLAKEWSLKCLVNFLRSHPDDIATFSEIANPIYTILTRLIRDEGELSDSSDTPPQQKSHLRLTATRLLIKLCSKRRSCEDLVTAKLFNTVALVAHDRLVEVRAGFTRQLKKYLGLDRLNTRWYTVLFLAAFEPNQNLKSETQAWLRSRATALARRQQQNQLVSKNSAGSSRGQQNTMELILARLLSLLAHHPDFPETGSENAHAELLDFAQYIIFYLQAVATEENLSLIFHIAQRVKQTADGVTGSSEASERLYILSDLAQAVIRHYADFIAHHHKGSGSGRGGTTNLLQTFPGKLRLPMSLFKAVANHEVAQEIAEKNYLPEEVAEVLERTVRSTLRPGKAEKEGRKRKSELVKDISDDDEDDEEHKRRKAKKAKKEGKALPVRKAEKKALAKTPRPPKKRSSGDDVPSSEPARKSSRKSGAQQANYAEGDSEEDDAEMEQWEKIAEDKPAKATEQNGDEEVDSGEENNADQQDEDGASTNGHSHREQQESPEIEAETEAEVSDEEMADLSSREPSPTPLTSKKPKRLSSAASKPSQKAPATRTSSSPVSAKHPASAPKGRKKGQEIETAGRAKGKDGAEAERPVSAGSRRVTRRTKS